MGTLLFLAFVAGIGYLMYKHVFIKPSKKTTPRTGGGGSENPETPKHPINEQ